MQKIWNLHAKKSFVCKRYGTNDYAEELALKATTMCNNNNAFAYLIEKKARIFPSQS